MTQPDFLTLLERDLQLRAIPFERGTLTAFVASAWPLIEDDPDVARWAEAFIEASRAEQLPATAKPMTYLRFPRDATAEQMLEAIQRAAGKK